MSITTGIGLISGIDTASLIDQLMAIEARPKLIMQARVADLQSRQAGILDINSRLLTLKNLAAGLRRNSVFDSASATSSDESILTATASNAIPGIYNFVVKQLVSTSQKLSKGFGDKDATPLGLTSLSFEFGNGKLSRDTDLQELNGGVGVRRGKIEITDSNGAAATVDLSTATTVDEVIEKINTNGTAKVTASVEGDHLLITDYAGGGGNVTIADAVGDFTATDLGIAKTGTPAGITGDDVVSIVGTTALKTLNDGTGVYLVDNNPDITITAKNGDIFNVDFGRVDNPITGATLLEDLNDGSGVTINDDSDDPDIRFVDKNGDTHDVDLTGLTTVQQVIDKIDSVTGGKITLSIDADGDQFIVTDTTGGGGLLKVQGAGANGEDTADDLGILNTAGEPGASFTGTVIQNADHTPQATTIQEIIDRINNAEDTLMVANGGRIVASIAADGVSLLITDNTAGGGDLSVASTAANPYAARDLGIDKTVADPGTTLDGDRLVAGLNSVLVQSLNGGAGISGNNTLTITDRTGATDTFIIDEDGSVSEIIAQINASGVINVTASFNDAGSGLLITDNTGSTASNLTIAGTAAAELGIAADVAADSVRGSNIQTRYVAEGSKLGDLNYGRGVGTGSFRITDANGEQGTVTIGSSVKTVQDLIKTINAQGPAGILARVNDNGDGILIENTVGSGIVKVETVSGTTAKDLNIVGESPSDGADIDGSYERNVTVNATDTLEEVVEAINDAGIPIAASIVSSGSGPVPYRIAFTSEITGAPGDLIIDGGGFDIGLTTVSEGTNAKVFFGAQDPADAIVVERPSNQLTDIVEGVTIDLLSADVTESVTVTVSRDFASISGEIGRFVEAFNDVVSRIDELDFYDVETETRGVLLGDPTPRAVKAALYQLVNSKATGLDTQFAYLSQVGITTGSDGKLSFDGAKFQAAYEEDPDAVEALFTAFDVTTTSTRELSPGVTITETQETVNEMGFGDLFDRLLDRLTNSVDGTVTTANNTIQDQIDRTNDQIESFDLRLASKREVLERQFVAMEQALARLQEQNNALLSLLGNISIAQGLTGG